MVFTLMGYDSRGNATNLIDPKLNTTVTVYAGAGVIVGIKTAISLPSTNQEQDYNLDALGNWSTTTITPEGGSPATQTRIHNKLNEVTKYGTTNVLYDHGNNTTPHAGRGNGNIADDGIRTYAYDAFNRLTTVKRKSDGATVGQYTYDALGRRVIKIVSNGGVSLAWSTLGVTQWSQLGVGDWAGLPLDPGIANGTTRYLYDQNQCAEELNASNSTTRQFIWGQYIDELIQMKTYVDTGSQPLTAGVYYLLSDLLYRSTALTDNSGDIVEAYDCDAYGNTLIFSGPGADTLWFTDDDVQSDQPACEYIFTGRQYDPESQIYFYRARYYLPPVGRFISRDPVLYRAGINLYQYTNSNSLVNIDPSGQVVPGKTKPAPPIFTQYPFVAGRGTFDATMSVRTASGTPTKGPNGGIITPVVLDPQGVDMDIKFKPNNTVTTPPCPCTKIDFVQYVTDTYLIWRFSTWSFDPWQTDNGDPYGTGGVVTPPPMNNPWIKGGAATFAHMQDSPGADYWYLTMSFKSEAICRAGPDTGKRYGTLNWGVTWDMSRMTKQYIVDGKTSAWLPYNDKTTTLTVTGFVPPN